MVAVSTFGADSWSWHPRCVAKSQGPVMGSLSDIVVNNRRLWKASIGRHKEINLSSQLVWNSHPKLAKFDHGPCLMGIARLSTLLKPRPQMTPPACNGQKAHVVEHEAVKQAPAAAATAAATVESIKEAVENANSKAVSSGDAEVQEQTPEVKQGSAETAKETDIEVVPHAGKEDASIAEAKEIEKHVEPDLKTEKTEATFSKEEAGKQASEAAIVDEVEKERAPENMVVEVEETKVEAKPEPDIKAEETNVPVVSKDAEEGLGSSTSEGGASDGAEGEPNVV
eukprot:TRINITY_DN606_c0_g1_i1.p2 TRINITY_DN606_c0_g1~~TRINITY_DN606_c0_g1_i1.p2  ORF type:complete len:283 (-),score=77.02 TRINITY_DN606_c0_g1_i1:265-1113(-)